MIMATRIAGSNIFLKDNYFIIGDDYEKISLACIRLIVTTASITTNICDTQWTSILIYRILYTRMLF